MGKKNRKKEKKESPWKDIPAGHGVTIPTDARFRAGQVSVMYKIADKTKK